jgi:hypothetical protein
MLKKNQFIQSYVKVVQRKVSDEKKKLSMKLK